MSRPSDIRDFIKARIREVIPKAVQSQNPHTPDTVGAMRYDESYYISFEPIAFNLLQGFSEITFPVEIEIGKRGGTDPIFSHDDILNSALDIATKINNRINMPEAYASVSVTTATPEPVLDNERWTKIIIAAEFVIHC